MRVTQAGGAAALHAGRVLSGSVVRGIGRVWTWLAQVAISVRREAPSLVRMCSTWLLAVFRAMVATAPTVLGHDMLYRTAPNRYGITPGFYERHYWLYESNPLGAFEDWNPNVSCNGTGDNGG